MVLTIGPVLFRQITPVGAVLMVIPVVVITMVTVVDAHLNAAFLRYRAGHDGSWCSNGRSQEQ
jgi:hypothetical protein